MLNQCIDINNYNNNHNKTVQTTSFGQSLFVPTSMSLSRCYNAIQLIDKQLKLKFKSEIEKITLQESTCAI